MSKLLLDEQRLRRCLGRFATGVTVVTCWLQGRPHGLTVNSLMSRMADTYDWATSLAMVDDALSRMYQGEPRRQI